MKKGILILCMCIGFLSILTACNAQEELIIEESESPVDTPAISLEEDLANRFTTDFSTSYAKELEDVWKANKDNEQIAAMYYYNTALFYQSIEQIDQAKNSLANISTEYSGVMSDEIYGYGIDLFGSKTNWDNFNNQKEESISKITDAKREEIKNWITQRYAYYDEKEGEYAGDKYTNVIFQEAAVKFGFSTEEIYNIWSDLPL